MRLALALAPIDFPRAIVWAEWVAHLGGHLPVMELSWHYEITGEQKKEFLAAWPGKVIARDWPGPDPKKPYPGGANRMFIFTMREAAKEGEPIFWIEADLVPLRKGWVDAVAKAYASCGKPFFGPHISLYDTPHMNGTAVYPPNWEELSDIAECPDQYPWDTFSRHSIVKAGQSADTRLIQHSFGSNFNIKESQIWKEAIIFHPCKDLSVTKWIDPSFKIDLPKRCYKIIAFNPNIHKAIRPYHTRFVAGCKFCYFETSDLQEGIKMMRLCGADPITRQEFDAALKAGVETTS